MKTWLIGAVCALLVAGVVMAREAGQPRRGAEPTVVATAPDAARAAQPVAQATRAPTAQPTRAPTARATERPTPEVTREAAGARANSVPTPRATAALPTHAAATATHASTPQAAAATATHGATGTPATGNAATGARATPTAAAETSGAAVGASGSTRPAGPTAVPPGTADNSRQPSKFVELTFDAGADRGYAEDILDILQSEHVVASFGMTGQWARANPELVRRMAADGHAVFNHTVDHRSFTGVSDSLGGLSAAMRRTELTDADTIIAPLIGHTTRPYYRLPYGDDDAHVSTDVAPAGYTQKIGWTVDSMGWRGLAASDIVARCLSQAAPGAIYVMHVGRASQDAIALPQIVRGLREGGFGFHRIDNS